MTTEKAGDARIIDAWDPLFALVLQLQQTADPGGADQLRSKLNEMLTQASARMRELGASEDAVNEARYAVVALLDEVVLTSSWPLRDAWLGRPLQMEHFNSFGAGEQFFVLLERVRDGSNPHKLELLEVFLTCLCLGFRGKHVGVQGLEVLRGLQRQILELLAAAAGNVAPQHAVAVSERDVSLGKARRRGDPGDLSPAWRPPHEPLLSSLPRELPVRFVAVACLGLVLVVYLIMLAALTHGSSGLAGPS